MHINEQIIALGPDAIVALVEREVNFRLTDAKRDTLRRIVTDGKVIAGRGRETIAAVVIQSLARMHFVEIVEGVHPMCARIGPRLIELCTREWERRRSRNGWIDRQLVVDYFAALDARRELALTSSSGKDLRGQAATNVVEAAHRKVADAERALRNAINAAE